MGVNIEVYRQLSEELKQKQVTLVAVSKTKPVDDIRVLYELGQRDFGENYVQELLDKHSQLPTDLRWHFIGHLQSNKVKFLAPFVHLIQGVDSLKLLKEINRQAARASRRISCLLQVHIAREETKFGLDEQELTELLHSLGREPLEHTRICGLMGMASFTDNPDQVRSEFRQLRALFERSRTDPSLDPAVFTTLSMGMSGDYRLAINEGSNLVRVGSLLFGARN